MAGHSTYHVNVIKLKWEIIWTGAGGPLPPCKHTLNHGIGLVSSNVMNADKRERYLINSYFSFVFEYYNISSVGHRSFLYLKLYFIEGQRVINFTTVTCSPLKIKSIDWWLIEHRRFSKNKWIPTQTYILDFGAPTTYKMRNSMPYSRGLLRLTGGFSHQQTY